MGSCVVDPIRSPRHEAERAARRGVVPRALYRILNRPQVIDLVIGRETRVQQAVMPSVHPDTTQAGGLRPHHVGRRSRDVQHLIFSATSRFNLVSRAR